MEVLVSKEERPSPRGNSDLPCPEQVKKLLRCRSVKTVAPQHVIYSQGESPHTVCIICSGLVKLTRMEANGNRVIVGLRRKGWVVGGVSAFLDVRYETTAETITRSRLCFIPAEMFLKWMDTSLEFSRWMARILSEALKRSIVSISDRSSLSGRQRLEKFLRKLVMDQNGSKPGNPVRLEMILKNWEVAQLLALTPQHLCRLIKQMEKEGVIVKKNGWLILPDPGKIGRIEMAQNELS